MLTLSEPLTCVPELEQKRGDTAHAAAGHTDQMNPVMLTREECWQVKRQVRSSAAEPVCGGGCAVTLQFSETSFMSRVFLHGRGHEPGRVFRRQTRRICRHLLDPLWILDQLPDFARKQFARDF